MCIRDRIFYDYAKALYGRRDVEIHLKEFDIGTVYKILNGIGVRNMEDIVKFYSIFGGIPKFYELLYNLKIRRFDDFYRIFLKNNYLLLFEEGKTMLISELGGEYKSYFTVLEAISKGKNKLIEIAVFFDNNVNATNRYINLLKGEYDLIHKLKPLIGKGSMYVNRSNFFDFWFLFINKYAPLIDDFGVERVTKKIEAEINSYFGKKFETFVMELFKEGLIFSDFTKIGKQWGKIKDRPKGENTYEVDIIALNEKSRDILFAECKWKNRVDARKVAKELNDRANHVYWRNKDRKEILAVFAKGFSKKIKSFDGKKVYCFDLKDLAKICKMGRTKTSKMEKVRPQQSKIPLLSERSCKDF